MSSLTNSLIIIVRISLRALACSAQIGNVGDLLQRFTHPMNWRRFCAPNQEEKECQQNIQIALSSPDRTMCQDSPGHQNHHQWRDLRAHSPAQLASWPVMGAFAMLSIACLHKSPQYLQHHRLARATCHVSVHISKCQRYQSLV